MAEEYRIKYLETPDIPKTPVGEEQGSGGGAVESVNGMTGAVTLRASDVGALPDSTVIPPAVTEQTVSGWGFTKNTGTYSKPSGGIPASDLASGVIPDISGKVDKESGYGLAKVVETQGNYSVYVKKDGGMGSYSVVSAATFATVMQQANQALAAKANTADVYTKTEIDNKGYQTASDVQTAISGVRQLPTVTAADNGKFLRVVSGAWAAETVSTWQGGSY